MIAWRHDLSTNRISQIIVGGSISLGLPSGDETSFEDLLEIIHPEDRAPVRETVANAISTHEPYEIVYRTLLSDGTIRWAKAYGQAYLDSNSKPIGLIGVVHDITDLKRSEEQMADSLHREHLFLRDVLSSVTEGKLMLCNSPADLPTPLSKCSRWVQLKVAQGLSDLREQARSACRDHSFSSERRQDFLTAVGEAATNAIVHAGGGRGRICSNDDTLQAWIEDKGHGIAVSDLPRATLERGYTTAGTFGHGLKLILQTVDRVHLLTKYTGTTVVVEQDRALSHPELE